MVRYYAILWFIDKLQLYLSSEFIPQDHSRVLHWLEHLLSKTLIYHPRTTTVSMNIGNQSGTYDLERLISELRKYRVVMKILCDLKAIYFLEFENQQLAKAVACEKQQETYLNEQEVQLKDALLREKLKAKELEKVLNNNKLQCDLNKRSLEW